MAIKKDSDKVTEKNGMRVTDNMDGEKKANDKLDMRKADVFNMRDYLKYKDAIQNDKDLKDVFPGDYPIKQLDLFNKLLQKENQES